MRQNIPFRIRVYLCTFTSALRPAQNSRVRQLNSALRHHLDRVPRAQFVAEIPAHAKHNDFPIEMPALKQSQCSHSGPLLPFTPTPFRVCTRSPVRTPDPPRTPLTWKVQPAVTRGRGIGCNAVRPTAHSSAAAALSSSGTFDSP